MKPTKSRRKIHRSTVQTEVHGPIPKLAHSIQSFKPFAKTLPRQTAEQLYRDMRGIPGLTFQAQGKKLVIVRSLQPTKP